MKKNFTFVFIVWVFLILLCFLSMWLVRVLPLEFKGLPIMYVGFVFNFLGASGVRQKENARFKKTDFRLRKFIVYNFEGDPHIPIRMIFHQLFSYVYLLIGLVVWVALYIMFVNNQIVSQDPSRVVCLILIYYSLGVGGTLLIFMMGVRLFDLLKYRGEFYVDSKHIR